MGDFIEFNDVSAQVKELTKSLKARSKQIPAGTTNAMIKACLLIESDAKILMTDSPATGRSYWKGKHGNIEHHASAPGEPPAVDTGMLRASVTHVIEGGGFSTQLVGRVGTHLMYGAYLEFGTSTMRPRPWISVALEINRSKLTEIFSVEMTSALQSGAPDIVNMSGEWGG